MGLFCLNFLLFLLFFSRPASSQTPAAQPPSATHKSPRQQKTAPRQVWNYDGGMFFETDGSLSETSCFRIYGRVTAKEFFDSLKRIDDNRGTTYQRGNDQVREFPEHLQLSFVIRDFPCSPKSSEITTRTYITREMMGKLRVFLYWKRGVELRPVENFSRTYFAVKPVPPYAAPNAQALPEKLEWAYELDIPSAGIPLSDGLVLVFRGEDGRIAARVAARM